MHWDSNHSILKTGFGTVTAHGWKRVKKLKSKPWSPRWLAHHQPRAPSQGHHPPDQCECPILQVSIHCVNVRPLQFWSACANQNPLLLNQRCMDLVISTTTLHGSFARESLKAVHISHANTKHMNTHTQQTLGYIHTHMHNLWSSPCYGSPKRAWKWTTIFFNTLISPLLWQMGQNIMLCRFVHLFLLKK